MTILTTYHPFRTLTNRERNLQLFVAIKSSFQFAILDDVVFLMNEIISSSILICQPLNALYCICLQKQVAGSHDQLFWGDMHLVLNVQ